MWKASYSETSGLPCGPSSLAFFTVIERDMYVNK